MPKKRNPKYKYIDSDDVIKKDERRQDFQIGQSFDDDAATTLICKLCGGDKFIVGVGSYYTVIKCPNCKYEVCVHDG